MSAPNPSNFALLIRLFKKHVVLLLAPVALFLALAAGYIVTSKPEWKATQSIQIRDELALQTVMPGRFDSLDMMKMVQETIHDTARRHAVVTKVLSALEPPADHKSPEQWPTIHDVEGLQAAISLSPPNGAEFGRTEILLLSVKSSSIERAKKTVAILAEELQTEINRLRDQRGLSMENELKVTVAAATMELELVSAELSEFEKGCGDILIDLRNAVSESGSGPSGLLEQKATLQKELRIAKQSQLELKNQIEAIQIARNDPNNVLSFSRELLSAQPTLQRLKEQLITIQSQTALTLGQFEEFHPRAKAAIKAESIIRQKIQEEVDTAFNGLTAQVEVLDAQIIRLQATQNGVEKQISKLAEVRAPYAEIVKQVEQKRAILNQSLQDLARAQATRAAAKTTNLISLIDGPYSGSKPEGLSKKIILGASGLAGLLSGVGLVFFAASPSFVSRFDDEDDPRQPADGEQPEWRREVLHRTSDEGSVIPNRQIGSQQTLAPSPPSHPLRKGLVSETNVAPENQNGNASSEVVDERSFESMEIELDDSATRVAIQPDAAAWNATESEANEMEVAPTTIPTVDFDADSKSKKDALDSTKVDFTEIQIGNDIKQILESSGEGVKNSRVKPMPLPRPKSPITDPQRPIDSPSNAETTRSPRPSAQDQSTGMPKERASHIRNSKTESIRQPEQSEKAIEERLQEAHRRQIEELLNGNTQK